MQIWPKFGGERNRDGQMKGEDARLANYTHASLLGVAAVTADRGKYYRTGSLRAALASLHCLPSVCPNPYLRQPTPGRTGHFSLQRTDSWASVLRQQERVSMPILAHEHRSMGTGLRPQVNFIWAKQLSPGHLASK